MPKKVVVTGLGIISSIGNNSAETLDSLMAGRSGIGPVSILETRYRDVFPVGEVKHTNEALAQLAGIKLNGGSTRASLLGLIAAKEAWSFSINEFGLKDDIKTALISATTVGGMDKTEQYYYDYLENDKYNHYVYTHGCNEHSEVIADQLGIHDHLTTISTACSSSANAIMLGARMIKLGIVDRVIAGGTDALTKFTINGFNSLLILDKEPCKPFDKNRRGLNLGEGAGYLVLESADLALKSKKKILCEISGFSNANDAYHQTASSPEGAGAFQAMNEALQIGGLSVNQIDYINAHGTGTDNNDITEGTAIGNLFSNAIPPVSSTKPFTGHTLAAAGAIEAIISILAIQNNMVFPNLNFSEKIEDINFMPTIQLISGKEINHVLSNSFGFGGNNTSLILSKY